MSNTSAHARLFWEYTSRWSRFSSCEIRLHVDSKASWQGKVSARASVAWIPALLLKVPDSGNECCWYTYTFDLKWVIPYTFDQKYTSCGLGLNWGLTLWCTGFMGHLLLVLTSDWWRLLIRGQALYLQASWQGGLEIQTDGKNTVFSEGSLLRRKVGSVSEKKCVRV